MFKHAIENKTSQVNPEMVTLARESRGMTQIDLAVASGVQQANISKYEGGILRIAEEHLVRIAEATQYPVEFFFQPEQRFGFGSSCTYHRKRQTMPVADLKRLLARINVLRIQVSRLLEGAEIDVPIDFPRLDLDEYKGSAEIIAQMLRRQWHLPPGPIVNLTRTLENAGGIVYLYPFGTRKLDAISQKVRNIPPLFFANAEVPGDRLRFTLSHEVGHIIMHRNITLEPEAEADRFAAEFLMPAADIAPDLNRFNLQRAAQLKSYWKVSMQALIRRARDLDKITDRQYRSMFEEMSRMGYRIEEPIPIPVEEPSVLKDIIDVHSNEYCYSLSDMSRLLLMHEEELCEIYSLKPSQLRLADFT